MNKTKTRVFSISEKNAIADLIDPFVDKSVEIKFQSIGKELIAVKILHLADELNRAYALYNANDKMNINKFVKRYDSMNVDITFQSLSKELIVVKVQPSKK